MRRRNLTPDEIQTVIDSVAAIQAKPQYYISCNSNIDLSKSPSDGDSTFIYLMGVIGIF